MSEFVTIGGEERPVAFGRSAYEEFEKITGMSLLNNVNLDILISYTGMTAMCFVGLKWGLYKGDGNEPKVKFSKIMVAEWLDAEGAEEAATKISQVFAASMPKQKKAKNDEAGEKPAGSDGTTSTP